MNEPVKRPYVSHLRTEQARATRRAIVAAAARLFIETGYGATTVDAIADAANVSRKTVFASVGGKAQALKLACDWAIAGDDEPLPMLERPRIRAAADEPDARKVLHDYASLVCEVGHRLAPLHRVAETARGSDPGVAQLAEDMASQRLSGMQIFAARLKAKHPLRRGVSVSRAADILWLFNDPGVYHQLVLVRGWTEQRFTAWLADTLITQLLAPTPVT